MRIHTCSNWGRKFLDLVIRSWQEEHEVLYKLGYDPMMHYESDVCFVDVCDHNAVVASKFRFPARLVIRCIDIECWVRQPRGVNWKNVDAVVFGAKHIRELVESLVDFPDTVEIHDVPFGVDLNQWSFRERDGASKRMACVCYRWSAKGLPLVLQVMKQLPGWSLHFLGKPSSERWLNYYVDQMVDELGLDVTFTDVVSNVDEWLEDKDAIILGSQKEAFSYAIAEGAAKGLKPVVHNFYGARNVWPDEWVWNTIDEAVDIVNTPWDSSGYRSFIQNHYSLEHMMEGLNRACLLSS